MNDPYYIEISEEPFLRPHPFREIGSILRLVKAEGLPGTIHALYVDGQKAGIVSAHPPDRLVDAQTLLKYFKQDYAYAQILQVSQNKLLCQLKRHFHFLNGLLIFEQGEHPPFPTQFFL